MWPITDSTGALSHLEALAVAAPAWLVGQVAAEMIAATPPRIDRHS
jgi:hypothetical protein